MRLTREVSVHDNELADWLTIVPEAHVRLLDFGLQHEMYDFFHQTWAARLGHIFGTGCLHTALGVGLVATVPYGSALFAVWLLGQALYGARIDKWVGLAMVPSLLAIAGGTWVVFALVPGGALAAAGGLALAGVVVQAMSHTFEPIPPPWSGRNEFVQVSEYVREYGLGSLGGLVLLALLGHVLELWAATRILPLQVLFVMLEAGYRPALRDATLQRRREIAQDPSTGWGRGAVGVERAAP